MKLWCNIVVDHSYCIMNSSNNVDFVNDTGNEEELTIGFWNKNAG
ncbi:hypothetical protein J437_LFUL012069 [Ladona fulva]|uniref:Uncharacterized protein n=1 Tax=Ladona fulva TaxID=123851 RepID=A0A8K0KCB1_LADFU|nr:hypothetical protein J437_LFUL012069 [Ladona fulva]